MSSSPAIWTLLQRCRAELAQVQGVLRVMEIHGAALLAEEMHQVTRYLQATAEERKNQAEALDALMRAMVQLPGYLDRVLAGGRDLALVLLPLLNDMRAVRGSPLLSEGTLLLLNLKSEKQASPEAPAAGEEDISVGAVGAPLRVRASRWALIGWIRGERVEQHLETLAAVATALRAGRHDAAAVPAVVGRGRGDRSAARARARRRRVDQAPAGPCRPRDRSGSMRWASRATRSTRRSSC